MTNAARFFSPLFFALVFFISSAMAQPILPVGKAISQDERGNAIYLVQSNGIDMAYKLIGSGEPLVMIPGLGNTMDRWPATIVEALSSKYQLIILDNRGMGLTTSNDTPFSYQLLADDVVGLMNALGVKKTNVLGFSMGSTITQKLLLEYPQRFNKAIIYATSTDGSNVAKALHGKLPDQPTIRRQIEATIPWKSPLDRMPNINNQVMFLVGTSDTTVGIESSKTLASAIPGAWLVQFKNATHHLMDEAPGEFIKVVLNFLNTNATVSVQK